MTIVIHQNHNIRGIPTEESELKVSLADDSVCFLDGSQGSFNNLFATLIKFSNCSDCKIDFAKSDAFWIGAKKGLKIFLFRIRVLLGKQIILKQVFIFLLKLGVWS